MLTSVPTVTKKPQPVERRTRRPQSVARVIDRVLAKSLRRNGFAHSEILTRWSTIVGEELAAVSCPEELRFAPHNHGAGVLTVRVAGGAALEFQHREPAIMERINAFFGFRAVRQLRLKQASMADISPKTEKRRMPTPVKVRSTRTTQNIEDSELRLALDRLASRIAPSGSSDVL